MTVEIQYGRKVFNDKLCGYATFEEDGRTIELISVPDQGLYVKANGKIIESPGNCSAKYVMAWTRVAGWLGALELFNQIKVSR